jgi:hypothetical protein
MRSSHSCKISGGEQTRNEVHSRAICCRPMLRPQSRHSLAQNAIHDRRRC